MAKSKTRPAKPAASSQPSDPNASPDAGLKAEIDEQMDIIRNDESDSGSVEKARGYLRDLVATIRFSMAISNQQIRAAIAGRLPSKSTARQYANLVAKIDQQMDIIRRTKDVHSPEFKQARKTLHKLMAFGRLRIKRERERLRLRGGFNGKRR